MSCNKIHALPKEVESPNTISYHFESSTCSCDLSQLCRFSYSKPNLDDCKMKEFNLRSTGMISNCDLIEMCSNDGEDNCDGTYSDGRSIFKLNCKGDSMVSIEIGKSSDYVIQINNCF